MDKLWRLTKHYWHRKSFTMAIGGLLMLYIMGTVGSLENGLIGVLQTIWQLMGASIIAFAIWMTNQKKTRAITSVCLATADNCMPVAKCKMGLFKVA